MFDVGSPFELPYPDDTHVDRICDSSIKSRKITIYRMRDLLEDPLTVDEFARRLHISRSRWLATAYDHDLEEFRQFYVGSSPRFRSPATLRIGLYERGRRLPVKQIGRHFEPTTADRRVMMRTIRHLQERCLDGLTIGILADDLRVHH